MLEVAEVHCCNGVEKKGFTFSYIIYFHFETVRCHLLVPHPLLIKYNKLFNHKNVKLK